MRLRWLLVPITLMSAADVAHAQASSTSWTDLIEKIKPAVVVIETDKGLGSGFFVKSNGTLVTNHHVIAGATAVNVRVANGEVFRRVYLLADSEERDLAILRVEGSNLPTVSLGDSNEVKVGEDVLLLGAPRGLEETVSNGIVSSTRLLESGTKVIQTTAAASPGSSGGPLVNRSGMALGVMSFLVLGGQNLNFAIPINYVQGMLDSLELLRSAPRLFNSDVSRSLTPTSPTSSTMTSRGVLVFAYRTPAHVKLSKPEVFTGIVDDLMLFLKSSDVRLVNDLIHRPVESEQAASTYTLVTYLRQIGASRLLHLSVDRPFSAWVKLTLRCYDPDGKLLWEEIVSGAANWGREHTGVSRATAELHKRLANRIQDLRENEPRNPAPNTVFTGAPQ
jgi:serine protease Do